MPEKNMSPITIKLIKQFCQPAIDAGIIPIDEFKLLIKRANCQSEYTKDEEHKLITKKEVADMLSVSKKTVERLPLDKVVLNEGVMIKTSKGNERRASGCIRYRYQDVVDFIYKKRTPYV